jgi:hypothetical protein
MDKAQQKWAIFCCDLLSPVIYGDIEAELIQSIQISQSHFHHQASSAGFAP